GSGWPRRTVRPGIAVNLRCKLPEGLTWTSARSDDVRSYEWLEGAPLGLPRAGEPEYRRRSGQVRRGMEVPGDALVAFVGRSARPGPSTGSPVRHDLF